MQHPLECQTDLDANIIKFFQQIRKIFFLKQRPLEEQLLSQESNTWYHDPSYESVWSGRTTW